MVRAPVVSPKKADVGAGSGDEGSDKENQKVYSALNEDIALYTRAVIDWNFFISIYNNEGNIKKGI